MNKNYYAQIQGQTQATAETPATATQQQPFAATTAGAQANPFAAAQAKPTQQSPFGQQPPASTGAQAPFQAASQQPQQFATPQQAQPMYAQPQSASVARQPVVDTKYPDPMIDYTLFNSDKSNMRCTTERIPADPRQFKDAAVPYGIIVRPFGDLPANEAGEPQEVPEVNFKQQSIVRCKDCRAYINPFVRWIDDGQRWICPFCGEINVTAKYYYSTIEADGYRTDHDERPELSCGTVDFICHEEYMNRPPMPPTYLFAFDVSKPAVESGYLAYACSTLKSVIEQQLLPGQGSKRVNIAFLTYDDAIQYYNLKPTLKQPQMLVMSDTEKQGKYFMPQPEDLLVNLEESYDLILNLLDNMPNYFTRSATAESVFVTALQCAHELLHGIGGKMVFFQVSQMILRHPKLQPAEDKAQPKAGVERVDLWQSTNRFFVNTGVELAKGQISFDLFDFSYGQKKLYKNVKTFADISAHSSGNMYYYPEFDPLQAGLKFSNDLYHNLTRKHAWEAVFRIRLSHGYQQTEQYGNMQIKEQTRDLVLCPTVDTDRVFCYEFDRSDSDAKDESGRLSRASKRFLFCQSALLYSTSDGGRRIRSHSIAIPLVNNIAEVHDFLDITATSAMLLRKAMRRFINLQNMEAAKQIIETAVNQVAKSYVRSQKALGNDGSFSENMQYFIIYALGMIKSPLVSKPVIMQTVDTLDKIVYQKFQTFMMSPEEIQPAFSPQIICISDQNLTDAQFPPLESLVRGAIVTNQAYLLYNAFAIYMYVGRLTEPWFLQEVFKCASFAEINKRLGEEAMFEGAESSAYLTALAGIIGQIRFQRQPYIELIVLLEGEMESEDIVRGMCIFDEAANPRYRIDYSRFMQRVTTTAGGQ